MPSPKYRRFASAFTRAAALTLAAAGMFLSAPPATAQTDTVIRIGTGPDDATTPVLYGVKSGIYHKFGLDVQPTLLTNGAAAMAAVAGGSLELGKNSALGLITAVAKGLPFTIIGALGFYNADKPDIALIVLTNSPIHTAKDLEGKTFGSLSLSDMNSIATSAWVDQHGGDSTLMHHVELPPSAALAAMEQGRVDATSLYEPFLSQYLATGKVRILGYPHEAFGRHFPNTLMFASKTWVAANPDVVERFLRATREAVTYVTAHESEAAPLLATFLKLDPSLPLNTHGPGRGVVFDPAVVQPMIDDAAKYKVIPSSFPAEQMVCGCALRR